ncbi:hypothetical protein GON26_01045 [Flavobacterium sp. GA093]|uniref:Uncharacterized protein n=1 Tax=Flavobacterium hydrocarbonoxydans TaxID=2683249 RepID=A0A6I4NPG9_9FLAO|nr:hypothetical protein [Flavobacterium hydrocarbonoxydans]MWB92937.1 hypothetical protein [Flavobacterium hydrocarbonoxydans]
MKTTILYVLFLITTALTLINRYTSFYINNSILHFIILFIAALTFVFIIGQLVGKLKKTKSQLLVFIIVGVLCFIKSFLTWGGDWKTQTILYKNLTNDNKNIELQMRGDRFSFGYKKRVVNRLKLFPGFDWTTDIDTTTIDHKHWKKMNLYVNEMKFASK